jgi:molybdopterin synthase catalytic subunit
LSARLTGETFDPWRELAGYQAGLDAGKFGACCSFTGTMRDFNAGDCVGSMRLDHYPDMTQRFLDTICDEARARWGILDCLIVHRYGEIRPNETIVLTAAWSAHRAEAFEACRYLIEELKARAPFWKKERTAGGERWVHDTITPE